MGKISSNISVSKTEKDILRQVDAGLGMMANDIEMIAAFKVPVDTGKLARYIRKFRVSAKQWKVTVNLPYAEYQERGMAADGSRVVKNYSRPGSGAHFLEDAVKIVSGRANQYFERAKTYFGPIDSKTGF